MVLQCLLATTCFYHVLWYYNDMVSSQPWHAIIIFDSQTHYIAMSYHITMTRYYSLPTMAWYHNVCQPWHDITMFANHYMISQCLLTMTWYHNVCQPLYDITMFANHDMISQCLPAMTCSAMTCYFNFILHINGMIDMTINVSQKHNFTMLHRIIMTWCLSAKT